jgi:hypothetical protein
MTDVTLWSPDQPYLYTLVTKLEKSAAAGGGGSSSGSALIVDEVRTVFGVRCGKRLEPLSDFKHHFNKTGSGQTHRKRLSKKRPFSLGMWCTTSLTVCSSTASTRRSKGFATTKTSGAWCENVVFFVPFEFMLKPEYLPRQARERHRMKS